MKIQNLDKGGRGEGGQPMWIILKFYIIILNPPTWIRGGGG